MIAWESGDQSGLGLHFVENGFGFTQMRGGKEYEFEVHKETSLI